jgi:hypothetical protein
MRTTLWERLDGETARAFATFTTYRDMGPERSQAKVVQESGKNPALIQRWSVQHHWVNRADAYDRFLDEEWVKTRAARLRQSAERNADLADAAIEKLADAIAKFKPKDMTPSAVARLMNATVRMQQLALGGSTHQVAVTGANGGALTVERREAIANLDQAGALERLVQVRDEIDRRLEMSSEFYKLATGKDLG